MLITKFIRGIKLKVFDIVLNRSGVLISCIFIMVLDFLMHIFPDLCFSIIYVLLLQVGEAVLILLSRALFYLFLSFFYRVSHLQIINKVHDALPMNK